MQRNQVDIIQHEMNYHGLITMKNNFMIIFAEKCTFVSMVGPADKAFCVAITIYASKGKKV